MSERAASVRHAPARLGAREADELACRSTGMVGVEWIARRLWLPFWVHRGKPALAASHPYADAPMPALPPLSAGPPAAAEDEVIAVAARAVPHVYFPFWHLRAGDADVLVCATSGDVVRASRGGQRRAEIQRGIAVLALAFFFGTTATFVADQAVAVAILTARAFGSLAEFLALLATAWGCTLGLRALLRRVLRPALAESAVEIAAGRSDAAPGPAVARFARWLGGLAILVVGFQGLLAFVQGGTPVWSLALTAVTGAALAHVALGLGRTAGPAQSPGGAGVRAAHPWAVAFRVCAHILGYALAGIFVNDVLTRTGIYLIPAFVIGAAIDSNQAQIQLVMCAVVRGISTSELERRERWPLMVGLFAPEMTEPFVGPVVSILLQLASVTFVNRWLEQRSASPEPLRQTVVRSLEIEAALVAGSLGGKLLGLLLLGTPGWTLGDVVGGLVTATLLIVPQRGQVSSDRRGH